MILLCNEIKEVKVDNKKYYIYTLILESTFPQNSGYKAAKLDFATSIRLRDIEPGEHYTIKRIPFVTPKEIPSAKTKNGSASGNRIKKVLAEVEKED